MLLINFVVLPLTLFVSVGASFSDSLRTSPRAEPRRECVVEASGSSTVDDAPAIRKALADCNRDGGRVIFKNTTYHVNSVLSTTNLSNVAIDIKGTLLWSTNIAYWLNNSLPVGYQNQSTAWRLGGDRLHINGFGYGTFDGNGQAWYDFVKGQSNYPGRPHGVTFAGLTNSRVEGLRFVQSQMWTISMTHCHYVVFDNIYVSSRSTSRQPARNTDGADTIWSSHITFSNWEVHNGDDCISFKANSTDMIIKDSRFYLGLGVAFGSIGQYPGNFETIERVKISNIQFFGTRYAVYFKTWTGEQVGHPPNGGGGGRGFATNITATNLTLTALENVPFQIGQCTTFSGTPGNCSSSHFQISDVRISNMTGTGASAKVADLRCALVTCPRIAIEGVDVRNTTTGVAAASYVCRNVREVEGFVCDV